MKKNILVPFFQTVFLLLSFEVLAIPYGNTPSKPEEGKPKTGFGLTFFGGTFNTIVTGKDYYFDESYLHTNYYYNAGFGLVLDFPFSSRIRFLLNPEIQMVSLERPVIAFNISLQTFLSRSFFLFFGGSGCLDDFSYGGAGPNLGLGFKAGRRNSFFIQSRLFYKKLPNSGELISDIAYQFPVSVCYRIDLAPTRRKSRPIPIPVYPPYKPEPSQPVEDMKVAEPQKVDTIPPIQIVPQQVIRQAPVDTVLQGPIKELSTYSYEQLLLLLDRVIKEEDYINAEKIQQEIVLRESSGNLDEIPVKRLEEMLQQAVKAEDYSRATVVQDELNKRKK